jgi:hypothetical protein
MGARLESAGRKLAIYVAVFIALVILLKVVIGVVKGFIFTVVIAALAVLALVVLNWGLGSRD